MFLTIHWSHLLTQLVTLLILGINSSRVCVCVCVCVRVCAGVDNFSEAKFSGQSYLQFSADAVNIDQ